MNQNETANGAPNGTDQPPVLYEDPHRIIRAPLKNRTIDVKSPAMVELTDSIRAQGIIQPLIVRKSGTVSHPFELIAGERRWLAGLQAKLSKVPIIVREATNLQLLELRTIENDQREDLTPLERAEQYQQLVEEYEKAGDKREKAVERLAQQVGKSRATVYEVLRLVDLGPVAKAAAPKIPQSQLGQVAKLKEFPDLQEKAVKAIQRPDFSFVDGVETFAGNEVMSFRDTKEMVDRLMKEGKKRRAWDQTVTEAKAKGQKVLSGLETERAIQRGCVSGSQQNYDFKPPNTYKQLMGKHAPKPLIGRDEEFDVLELYEKADVEAAIKANGRKPIATRSSQTAGSRTMTAETKRMKEKAAKTRRETAERRAIVDAVVGAAGGRMNWTAQKTLEFLKFVVRAMKQRVLHDTHREMFARRKLDPKQWKKGYQSASSRWLNAEVAGVKTADQARALIVDMAVALDLTMWAGEFNGKEPKMLNVACEVFGVNPAKAKRAADAKPAKPKPQKKLSTAGRKRLGELMKARWAARRKDAAKSRPGGAK